MLATVGAWFVKTLLGFLWSKLAAFLGGVISGAVAAAAHNSKQKKVADDAKQSVEPLKQAETGQEIDDAAKDALGGV